jgi:shikimate dehydrogenase
LTASMFQFVGLLGHPVAQSKSPIMHNASFRKLNLPYAYAAFDIPPAKLQEAMNSFRTLQFRGANVTIPHKEAIIEYLDDISDEAKSIGAVNTLVNDAGRWIGYNTDGIGYIRSLREEMNLSLDGLNVLVLGAGGAARAIGYSLLKANVASCWIANRTTERAEQLAKQLCSYGNTTSLAWNEIPNRLPGMDVVINTTSVGMYPYEGESPLDSAWIRHLPEHSIISDLVYNPITTRLLREASDRGLRVHGGLGMFIYQGAYAFEYWTGHTAPIEMMRRTIHAD